MTTIDYERVKATRAPVWQRQLIRIPEDSISCHHSSLTDYLDRTVCYSPEGMRQIDSLIEKYRLGAVNKTMNDHYGTVLPRINRKDQILGGSVIYFDAEKGDMLKSEPLTAQGGLSVAGRCRCLTKDSNTSIEKEGYIPYSLQA